MKKTSDLWDEMGSLPEDDIFQVLTRLFTVYEERLTRNSADPEAENFFRNLENAMAQASQCNSNRKPF